MRPWVPAEHDTLWRRIRPAALLLACILGMTGCLCAALHGDEGAPLRLDSHRILTVPSWVLRGIAMQETSSYYRADGSICYVNHMRGAAGEVGVFQMKRAAFAQVHLLPLMAEAAHDPACAEFCAIVYLRWCYRQTGSWAQAVPIYHTGPDGDADDGGQYLRDIETLGRRNF